MRLYIVGLCLAALAIAVSGGDDPTASLAGVTDLTPDTFDKLIDGSKAALIEFYAPWCGHCKHLTPEYKKLGETVAGDPTLNSQVVIAKVNADEHRSLGERFAVRGFPTIKWFPRGRSHSDAKDYNGARTADAFLSWIKKEVEADASFARVPELAAIAYKFVQGDISAEEAVKQTKEAAGKVADAVKDNAALYVKYLEKAGEKGKEWVGTEVSRLQKMTAGGKMSSAKLLEVSRKLSVLESFTKAEPIKASTEAEEPEDEVGDEGDYEEELDFGEGLGELDLGAYLNEE